MQIAPVKLTHGAYSFKNTVFPLVSLSNVSFVSVTVAAEAEINDRNWRMDRSKADERTFIILEISFRFLKCFRLRIGMLVIATV